MSDMGSIAIEHWERLPNRFPCVTLDQFVIMPNHLHGIIIIVGARFIAPQNENLMRVHGVMNEGAMNRAPTMGRKFYVSVGPHSSAPFWVKHGNL